MRGSSKKMDKGIIQRGCKGDRPCDHPKGDQEAGSGQGSTGRGAAKCNQEAGVSIGQSGLRIMAVERKAAASERNNPERLESRVQRQRRKQRAN